MEKDISHSPFKNISILTDEGKLEVSKIKDGIAYDQDNSLISRYHFRFQLGVLSQDWVNPKYAEKLANASQS